MLNIRSFDKALLSLTRAIARHRLSPQDEEVRDAVIQRFEYCYELSWKMLKRQLEMDLANSAAADAMSFKELIREGFERGYIERPEDWFYFRERRNEVSHTYSEEKAIKVVDCAFKLEIEARKLYQKLSEKNDRIEN